jgi:uncharacterized protein (TIGR02300 family)
MADLGQKHECRECGAKFYDLGKADSVCPRCGTSAGEEDEEPRVKSRRKRRPPIAAKVRVADPEAPDVEAAEVLDDDDEIAVLETDEIDDEEIADFDDEDEDEEEVEEEDDGEA